MIAAMWSALYVFAGFAFAVVAWVLAIGLFVTFILGAICFVWMGWENGIEPLIGRKK